MATVDLKYSTLGDAAMELCFEPIGTTFNLVKGKPIFLRVPIETVGSIETVLWPNGIGVWLPYPGDYVVLDEHGREIDRV